MPWQCVDVDMIGPFKVKTPSGKRELHALTMIDPTMGWFEVKDIEQPDSECCMAAFNDTWLSRYPRLQFLGFDGGSKYKSVFDQMHRNYGMKPCKSSAYNPQANGVVE